MKQLYLITLFIITSNCLSAQDFLWAKAEGKWAYDYGYGIATDNNGNVYVTGKYEEHAVFSGTTLPNEGNHDMFLAQYSASGTLNWMRTAGGISGDYARILACDKTSHVYVAGEIEGPNTINFPGSSITVNANAENDVLVASYDLSGNLLWAKCEGYTKNEKALGISYDQSGNVIVCGYFTDTSRFGGSMVYGKGDKDIFIAKYDMNGNFLWMKHAGGPGEDEAKSVVCDSGGNIYICGKYSNGMTFGNTTFNTPNTPYGHFYNAYIAKYAPDGSLVWAKSAGGDYDDLAWSITRDHNNRIYITGEFSGAMFDNIPLYTNGKSDVFVACYDENGNAQWAVNGGGTLSDRARGIGCDGNKIYITGQFGLNAVFGQQSVSAADSSDIFMSSLDNNGNFLWTMSVGGSPDAYEFDGYESGIAICADTNGTAYATGALLNGGTFGGTSLNGYTRTDVFIAKISTIINVNEMSAKNDFQVYPNPGTGILNIRASNPLTKISGIKIYNYTGQLIKQLEGSEELITLDLSGHSKGLYFTEVKTDSGTSVKKYVLQ
ncbi:MAG TPA: T9SS type A sorting domain-containing protein [Bacteroidia bacterium]|jgi:hypothetical protein